MRTLLLCLIMVASCKTGGNSTINAAVTIAPDERLDLTKYQATPADLAQFRQELGADYDRYLQQLQQGIADGSRPIPDRFKRLSPEEWVAIYHYSNIGFRSLNKVLRQQDIAGTAKQAGFIKVLSSGLNKLPPTTALAYRTGLLPAFGNGEYFSPFHELRVIDPERLAQFKVGQIYVESGFLSTSQHDPNILRLSFGCREAFYTVQSKYGRDISALAGLPGEREVLFVPGSEFKIVKMKHTFPPANQCAGEVVELEVEEVEPGTYQADTAK